MKKWTVMLIPHDRGNTRSLSIYAFQIWFVAALVIGLSFISAFLYRRQAIIGREAAVLRQDNRRLGLAKDTAVAPAGLTERQRADIERRIRSEYEARDAAITSELTDLYDVETQLRKIHALPPRTNAIIAGNLADPKNAEGGKGGPEGELASTFAASDDAMYRPPQVIYGVARPSADMIVQEINIRTRSLKDLLASVKAQRDRVARIPSLWPSLSPRRRLSSGFGFRKDPFTSRISHHDGDDISAPWGSPVVATAKGRVVVAGWEHDYGNLVRIDHGGGIQTGYGHMSAILVKVGQIVNKGQIIGRVGSTGRSTGPHIHYEIRIKGVPVDPEPYLLGN